MSALDLSHGGSVEVLLTRDQTLKLLARSEHGPSPLPLEMTLGEGEALLRELGKACALLRKVRKTEAA